MRVVFCLPGKQFSNNFLMSWSKTLIELNKNNIDFVISNKYLTNVFHVRNACLGGDILRGSQQKPWDNKLEYDYIFWLDSDIVFSPEQVIKMLNTMEDKKDINILSGLYLMKGGFEYATVDKGEFTNEKFIQNGGSYKFINKEEILLKEDNLFEVEYTGFGFICVRKGMFEKLTYPWFKPYLVTINVDLVKQGTEEVSDKLNIVDTLSEDVAFCRDMINNGEKIWCDPTIIVGHEKETVYHFDNIGITEQLKKDGIYEEQIKLLKEKYNKQEEKETIGI